MKQTNKTKQTKLSVKQTAIRIVQGIPIAFLLFVTVMLYCGLYCSLKVFCTTWVFLRIVSQFRSTQLSCVELSLNRLNFQFLVEWTKWQTPSLLAAKSLRFHLLCCRRVWALLTHQAPSSTLVSFQKIWKAPEFSFLRIAGRGLNISSLHQVLWVLINSHRLFNSTNLRSTSVTSVLPLVLLYNFVRSRRLA